MSPIEVRIPDHVREYRETPEIGPVTNELVERLHRIWETKPGIMGFIGTVDHKTIGIRYLVTAFIFLIFGGIEALILRLQLARPENHMITGDMYNMIFTMHGITMIFLYALPILSGFSNYLYPLFFGTRDMAYPRLNAFSYWIFLAAGIFMYTSFMTLQMPNDGWYNYAPFSEFPYNQGLNMNFYAIGMIFLGISTTVGSVNFVVTFLRMRAPGMSINRIPIMVWGTFIISVANLFAVPTVSLAFFMLWLDRMVGTHFFEVSGVCPHATGALCHGRPLLWQHLFWLYAHPWVYVIVLPAMGIVSDALPTFCRRPLVGYTLVILGSISTMILGFGVWVHHMFTTGLPYMSLSYFSGVSFIITIPSAVAVFCWIATIWTGRVRFSTPFLYMAAFIVLFVIGGVSGVATASAAADQQLNFTYFVVAHIHYVLIGINVFGVLAGIHYWFPKWTGRMMNEAAGKIGFWVIFIGFNLGFFPMHLTGLLGMPRRIFTYPPGLGWDTLNMVETIGAFIFAVGIFIVLINILVSAKAGLRAGDNPWDAPTLEWAVASPPPPYNFAVIPVVASRHPLWEDRLHEGTGRSSLTTGLILDNGREQIATTAIDAAPAFIAKMPGDDPWPFLVTVAMSLGFTGMLFAWWWMIGVGIAFTLLGVLIWLWPRKDLGQRAGVRV